MSTSSRLFLMLAAMLALSLLLWPVSPTRAQDLPPRPTPPPFTTPTAVPEEPERGIQAGAYIELQPLGAALPERTWTAVQWEDAQGEWHTVEGWQGTLDSGRKRWWVHPGDFRKGPFRWVLYDGLGGAMLESSASFFLPSGSHEVVAVKVTIGD